MPTLKTASPFVHGEAQRAGLGSPMGLSFRSETWAWEVPRALMAGQAGRATVGGQGQMVAGPSPCPPRPGSSELVPSSSEVSPTPDPPQDKEAGAERPGVGVGGPFIAQLGASPRRRPEWGGDGWERGRGRRGKTEGGGRGGEAPGEGQGGQGGQGAPESEARSPARGCRAGGEGAGPLLWPKSP